MDEVPVPEVNLTPVINSKEVPDQNKVSLTYTTQILSRVEDAVELEEEIVGLTRKRKSSVLSVSKIIDKQLTSDNAQVNKIQDEKIISDQSDAEKKTVSDTTQSDYGEHILEDLSYEEKKKKLRGSCKSRTYKESPLLMNMRVKGIQGKEGHDKGGIGFCHSRLQTGLATTYRDPYPIIDRPGETITQRHLDRIESIQILIDTHDGDGDKEKMAIFLNNDIVYRIADTDLWMKSLRELEYIHYMMQVKNEATQRWSNLILKTIKDKRRFHGIKSDEEFTPNFVQDDGTEVNMQRNNSTIEDVLGTRCLVYNNESNRPKVIIQLGDGLQRSKASTLR